MTQDSNPASNANEIGQETAFLTRRSLESVAATELTATPVEQAASDLPHMLRALRHADFRHFWAGNFLSNIGTWMQNVAQGWLVLSLSNSPFWLGVIGFASSAPMLIFTLIGGVIADHVDRRKLMIYTQAAMMVLAFIMALLTWLDVITIPQIALLAFATGVAMSLNTPAYQATVPQLVPREDLSNAIGLNSAQFNMSRVLGPSLGGFAMAVVGPAGNFVLNGLSFMALLFVLRKIELPPVRVADELRWWHRLVEGFQYIYRRREMFALIMLVATMSLFGLAYAYFVPFFARDVLGLGELGLGLLMACSGLGAFLGAATVAARKSVHKPGRFVVASGSVFFLTTILFAFSRHRVLSGVLIGAAGCTMILMVATINIMLQHLSADEMRGRVMSIYATAFLGFAPLGSLLAGVLTRFVPIQYAIAGMSSVALLGTWAIYYTRPELRKLKL